MCQDRGMVKKTGSPQRREDSLSRDRIVEASIALLDSAGEGGLTFRALSERLATGPGAIYWHVANKGDLLVAACDAVIAGVMAAVTAEVTAEVTAAQADANADANADAQSGAQRRRGDLDHGMLLVFEGTMWWRRARRCRPSPFTRPGPHWMRGPVRVAGWRSTAGTAGARASPVCPLTRQRWRGQGGRDSDESESADDAYARREG